MISTICYITLLIDRYNDRVPHSSGNSCLFHKELISLWTTQRIVLPAALINSAGIWTIPGDLCPFSVWIAIWTSKPLGWGTSGSAVCISVCLTSLIPWTFNSWGKWHPQKCEKGSVLLPSWLYSTITNGAWLWQTVLSHRQHNFIINKTS